jgi:hypothetical protein
VYRSQTQCQVCERFVEPDQVDITADGYRCWRCTVQLEIRGHLARSPVQPPSAATGAQFTGRPRQDIGALPHAGSDEGMVAIAGTASPLAAPLHAPLSGVPCLGYLLVVTEEDDDSPTREVLREGRTCDFLLRDDTGVACIMGGAPGLSLLLHLEKWCTRVLHDPSMDMEELMARHQQSARDRNLTFEERVLRAGEHTAVRGGIVELASGLPPGVAGAVVPFWVTTDFDRKSR